MYKDGITPEALNTLDRTLIATDFPCPDNIQKHICPLDDEGCQIEWYTGNEAVEVEISADGTKIDTLTVLGQGEDRKYTTEDAVSIERVGEIVKKWVSEVRAEKC